MHEQNIETLRKEAVRLLALEKALLCEMLEKEGVLTDSQNNVQQTFDRASALQQKKVLENEKKKLDSLEMVLAVVGTMKAGKSTTINAIVGTEVLPNRNQPMTSLPTLIRHVKGNIEPVLKFENIAPINTLLDDIKRKSENPDTPAQFTAALQEDNLKSLLEKIKSGLKPKKQYESAKGIFEFLTELNDLVRLARALNVDFPYSSYEEMHELPVIEVEFAHLRDADNVGGCLTLLDTPGPNEAGQPQMLIMLQDQLKKASAVLTVLDYSQLKSEAEAKVREELNKIADVSKDRLYVVVNKFDQKDCNSIDADNVKIFVAENIFGNEIGQEKVFPVSAKLGYLANRARHELFHNKKLPDPNLNSWVVDFGEKAMGCRWTKSIDDIEEVASCAATLWENSRFDAPLEKVIKRVHACAATLAVSAAAAKLVDTASRVENLLNTRETALNKTAKELEMHIKSIVVDIQKLNASEQEAKDTAKKAQSDLDATCKKSSTDTHKKISALLEDYFKEGKALEKTLFENEQKEEKQAEWRKSTSRRDNRPSKKHLPTHRKKRDSIIKKTENDFDPENPLIKLNNKKEAEDLIARIGKSITAISLEAADNMQHTINLTLQEFKEKLSSSAIHNATTIVNAMTNRMSGDGFNIKIELPDTCSISLSSSGKEVISDVINEKNRTVTRTRAQDGFWGSTKRFLDFFEKFDWGYEDYKKEEKFFEIDIHNIREKAQSGIDDLFKEIDAEIVRVVQNPLQDNIQQFFDSVKVAMEAIRGDLLQGKTDGELKKEAQQRLLDDLKMVKKKVPGIRSDSSQLKMDIEQAHPSHELTLAEA